jgi:NADH-quinone oxidoreductase subunit N
MVTANDLMAILPFLVAAGGGLVVILLDVSCKPASSRRFLGSFALITMGVMFGVSFVNMGRAPYPAFFGLIVSDDFSRVLSIIFALAAALAVLIAMGRLPDEQNSAARGEFYALLLFATGGASLLVSAADLVSLFIGLETLSIPAYILAAGSRRDKRSAEAGLKYFILGAFATGFLVYGIALLYGAAGSTSLSAIAKLAGSAPWAENPLLIVGSVFILVGLVFKISAVPFHMWAPDVYQGSPTPVTAFFATGVKAAAFAALLRVLYVALPGLRIGSTGFEAAGWFTILQGLAIATMTVANLVALVQKDVKRILAYSSVVHAGYLIIGLLCMQDGAAAIVFYLLAYTFMTVGAFALVAYFEHAGAGTSLREYIGLGRRHPVASVVLAIFLFSLAGIPPTAGFFGKFYLFKSAVDQGLVALTIVAVINSMISAYYYLRVTVYMYMQKEETQTTDKITPSTSIAIAVGICLLFVLAIGLYPTPYLEAARASVASLF